MCMKSNEALKRGELAYQAARIYLSGRESSGSNGNQYIAAPDVGETTLAMSKK